MALKRALRWRRVSPILSCGKEPDVALRSCTPLDRGTVQDVQWTSAAPRSPSADECQAERMCLGGGKAKAQATIFLVLALRAAAEVIVVRGRYVGGYGRGEDKGDLSWAA